MSDAPSIPAEAPAPTPVPPVSPVPEQESAPKPGLVSRALLFLIAIPRTSLSFLNGLLAKLASLRHVAWWLGWTVKLAGLVVFSLAWVTAQSIRFLIDLDRRKRLCQAATDQAAKAVARSYTVRTVYTLTTMWALFSGRFWTTAVLVAMFTMAEVVWQFVLYTAALVGRLDDGMEVAVVSAQTQVNRLGEAAEHAIQSPAHSQPAAVPVA